VRLPPTPASCWPAGQGLSRLLEDPERPFAAVLGGSRVSAKLAVLDNLLGRVDSLVVGGGMCFTSWPRG
jgi:3-phosphoglycerate kinase